MVIALNNGTPTVINNILGDKNDYTTEKSDIVSDSSVSDLFRAKFSVEGFEHVIMGLFMFLLLLGTGQSSPTRYWLPTKSTK